MKALGIVEACYVIEDYGAGLLVRGELAAIVSSHLRVLQKDSMKALS